MRIQHNITSLNVYRNLCGNNSSIAKNLEKLSSGYKINRAGDDAAGLAVSEKMRAQITSLNQAVQNAEDGISLVQTVEGAMTEVHTMLNRMMELSVQSASGTYTDEERSMMDAEVQQIKTEISRIGKTTTFNSIRLFPEDGDGSKEGIATYGITLDLQNQTCEVDYINMPNNASGVGGSRAASGHEALAERIATEFFPNAISQIFDAFPALKNEVGSEKIGMELHVRNIDGKNGMLAYAQFSFYKDGRPFGMQIRVDAADFSDASIEAGSPDAEKLESTIAHELMHSVMQYTMTDGMSGRNGAQKFPEWFTEGIAQLAGGGFPTNWNSELEQIAQQITSSADGSQDGAVGNYLKKYSVAGRPYGHGYLASAYIGYLANGGGAVTGAGIAAGMNKIFDEIINNKASLYDAISKHTGGKIKSMADVEQLFRQADPDLTTFVRQLAFESKGGAGSVITAGLNVGGNSIIGDSVKTDQAFHVVDKATIPPGEMVSVTGIQLMVGSDSNKDNLINVELFAMNPDALGIAVTNVLGQEDARAAIQEINDGIDKVSSLRGYYGALQNRLEHTVSNLGNVVENLSASESRIRDTDMAMAMMEYVRNQILVQSSQAMLSQANQQPNSVLQLLSA
ncbi:flagellinolysin [Sporofaciens musculi]|uniref:flagellinolysin n=1 Tax=Sporofaciens musculi TaxID=2681861 RepID=UPI002570EBC0|nr:flagellinolysin [Sporofaciens musculi]